MTIGLPYRAAFEYGLDPLTVLFETTIPQRPWTVLTTSVGGSRTASAGLPAAYIVRRDELLEQVLRFYEEEWPDVRNMVAYAQQHPNTVGLYMSAGDLDSDSEPHVCYLESPLMGEEVRPQREGGTTNFVYTLTLLWRKADGTVWDDIYYPVP